MPEQFSHSDDREDNKLNNATLKDFAVEIEEALQEEKHEATHQNVAERQEILTNIIHAYGDEPETLRKIDQYRHDPQPLALVENELRRYLAYARQFPPITDREDAAIFFEKIETGLSVWQAGATNKDSVPANERAILIDAVVAHRVLLSSNLGLIPPIARRNVVGSLTVMDLIQEGIMGLNKAIPGFDHTKKFKFGHYASIYINGHIKRAVANQARLIKTPVNLHDSWRRLVNSSDLVKELGHEPTDEELAQELAKRARQPVKNARAFLRMSAYHLSSIDAALSDEDRSGALDEIFPENQTEVTAVSDRAIALASIERVFKSKVLSDLEKFILAVSFGKSKNVPNLEVKGANEELIDTAEYIKAANERGIPPSKIPKIIGMSPQGFHGARERALQKARAIIEGTLEESPKEDAGVPYYKRKHDNADKKK